MFLLGDQGSSALCSKNRWGKVDNSILSLILVTNVKCVCFCFFVYYGVFFFLFFFLFLGRDNEK